MSAQQPTPPPATWAPGMTVPGTVYRIIRPLGSGGMGDVYEAEHDLLGVRRALKVLSRRLADREDLAERLRVEARALANLRHPNLVEVHDLGVSSDGRIFFSMELLIGTTLRDVLRRNGTLKMEQATDIAIQILDALDAAHEQGMIHRDVKPENIFLQQAGVVKLLDFGVAKTLEGSSARAHQLTAAGTTVGTPRYMSPEQAEGNPIDRRSDLYSVGLVLWEMLVGKPPYAHLDHVAAAMAAATRGVPSLEEAGPSSLPAELCNAVKRATARVKEDRYSTAAAFCADLRVLRGRSSYPQPVWESAKRLRASSTDTVRYDEVPTLLTPGSSPTTLQSALNDGSTTKLDAIAVGAATELAQNMPQSNATINGKVLTMREELGHGTATPTASSYVFSSFHQKPCEGPATNNTPNTTKISLFAAAAKPASSSIPFVAPSRRAAQSRGPIAALALALLLVAGAFLWNSQSQRGGPASQQPGTAPAVPNPSVTLTELETSRISQPLAQSATGVAESACVSDTPLSQPTQGPPTTSNSPVARGLFRDTGKPMRRAPSSEAKNALSTTVRGKEGRGFPGSGLLGGTQYEHCVFRQPPAKLNQGWLFTFLEVVTAHEQQGPCVRE